MGCLRELSIGVAGQCSENIFTSLKAHSSTPHQSNAHRGICEGTSYLLWFAQSTRMRMRFCTKERTSNDAQVPTALSKERKYAELGERRESSTFRFANQA